jgi:hypothetical protein
VLSIRPEQPPGDAIVVRGGLLAADTVRRSIELCMIEHGFYGLSVFVAEGGNVRALVPRVPDLAPERYRRLRLSSVDRIGRAGFSLLATFDSPHFDVQLPDSRDETLTRLQACFDGPIANPAAER